MALPFWTLKGVACAALLAIVVRAVLRADIFWSGARSIPLGTVWRAPGFAHSAIPDLHGKVALVTGANAGLGWETALQLALANATVVLGCRDKAKGHAAALEINSRVKASGSHGNAYAVEIDLADLRQVQEASELLLSQLPALHILVNNAGIPTQFPHTLTADGLEITFQVNYLGHFLLTTRLLPLLEQSAPARVVHVSSGAHRGAPAEGVPLSRAAVNDPSSIGPYARYGMAKLANVAFARELDRQSFNKSLFSNAVHPGVVATSLLRLENFQNLLGPWLGAAALQMLRFRNQLFAYSAREAALTILYCAAAPEVERKPLHGDFFVPVATRFPTRHPKAEDSLFWQDLWDFSQALIDEALNKKM